MGDVEGFRLICGGEWSGDCGMVEWTFGYGGIWERLDQLTHAIAEQADIL